MPTLAQYNAQGLHDEHVSSWLDYEEANAHYANEAQYTADYWLGYQAYEDDKPWTAEHSEAWRHGWKDASHSRHVEG